MIFTGAGQDRAGWKQLFSSQLTVRSSQFPVHSFLIRDSLLVASQYRIQPIQNTAASLKLQAVSQYRIQLKAKGLRPNANTKYSCKPQASSCKPIQNTAASLKL
jgi:hypothetical protein